MDILYAAVQGTYKSFEVALFQGSQCLQVVEGDKGQASSHFLVTFEQLLQDNSKKFCDLRFISVDQGPGAFTSLRVIIAAVNALAFGRDVGSMVLIGVDGLDALALQTYERLKAAHVGDLPKKFTLVSLLNAYNKEVYYAVHDISFDEQGCFSLAFSKSYKNIDLFLQELYECPRRRNFVFTGNGATLHQERIKEVLGNRVLETFGLLETCSAETVGRIGLCAHQGDKQPVAVEIGSSLKPLYLKAQTFAVKPRAAGLKA